MECLTKVRPYQTPIKKQDCKILNMVLEERERKDFALVPVLPKVQTAAVYTHHIDIHQLVADHRSFAERPIR